MTACEEQSTVRSQHVSVGIILIHRGKKEEKEV